jgi:hypothetical protein
MIIVGRIPKEILVQNARHLKYFFTTIKQFGVLMIFLGLLGCSIFSKENKSTMKASEAYIFEILKEHWKTFGFYIRTDTASTLNNKGHSNRVECFLECGKQKITLRQVQIHAESEDIPSLPMLFFIPSTDGEFNEDSCKTIIFSQHSERSQFPFKIQQVEGSLFAYAYMFEISDSLILFGIDVVRTSSPGEEYFPTSERLRVEIQNMLGKSVWRSDEDVYFLQVIGDVEPKEIGSCYRYVKFWNRKGNNGKFIGKGKFKVMLTLPIQPKSITKYLEINLGE